MRRLPGRDQGVQRGEERQADAGPDRGGQPAATSDTFTTVGVNRKRSAIAAGANRGSKDSKPKKSKDFKCETCPKEYVYKKLLEKHEILDHQKGRDSRCKKCPFITSDMEEMLLHQTVHTEQLQQLSCERCQYLAMNKNELEYHLQTCGDSEEELITHPCKAAPCLFTGASKVDLFNHVLRAHPAAAEKEVEFDEEADFAPTVPTFVLAASLFKPFQQPRVEPRVEPHVEPVCHRRHVEPEAGLLVQEEAAGGEPGHGGDHRAAGQAEDPAGLNRWVNECSVVGRVGRGLK
jgi:hypothetical protein